MKHTNTRGFTLIELLVVIAIIGILASVVLASLNTAQDKGSSAAIKSDINSARGQSELFYDTGLTYAGVCADSKILEIGTAIDAETGASSWTCEVSNDGQALRMYSELVGANAGFFCSDSTGRANQTAAVPPAVTPATNATYVCPAS